VSRDRPRRSRAGPRPRRFPRGPLRGARTPRRRTPPAWRSPAATPTIARRTRAAGMSPRGRWLRRSRAATPARRPPWRSTRPATPD